MIKFKALIHKETGTIIKYEDWLKNFKENLQIRFTKIDLYEELARYSRPYNAIELITSDDFKIIYDSEFTYEEIETMYCMCMNNSDSCENLELKDKLLKRLNDNYNLNNPKFEKLSDNINKIYKANKYETEV
ncbi:hypothetical protein CLSAB_19270 [Clostridium saccharobutylicum]|uniref:hypothetical protein n=1 Tax=Clostridium saccharobutylicum TaxID=169679 RepID=UPI00098CE68E|nr:hypothetical protein [Clostridium saccharobutylicum]OOM17207.1 hypothetical protein CLSAB_19270 [Clostridium saccharobutylicum]